MVRGLRVSTRRFLMHRSAFDLYMHLFSTTNHNPHRDASLLVVETLMTPYLVEECAYVMKPELYTNVGLDMCAMFPNNPPLFVTLLLVSRPPMKSKRSSHQPEYSPNLCGQVSHLRNITSPLLVTLYAYIEGCLRLGVC